MLDFVTRMPPVVRRYAVPVITIALGCLITWASSPFTGLPLEPRPHPIVAITFLTAIILSAWQGGYGPGLVACFIVIFGVPYLFSPGFSIARFDATRLALLLLVSVLVSRIAAGRARVLDQLQRMNEALDDRVRSRTAELQAAVSALRESESRLFLAMEAGRMGTWDWDIRTDRVTWSPQIEAIHGIPAGTFEGTLEASQRDVHPDCRDSVAAAIAAALRERRDYHAEYRILRPDGETAWLEAYGQVIIGTSGEPERMVGICMEATARKNAEFALLRQAEELARSNTDLQQFTYVASHDLQEPLRMIGNYSQLLSRRYHGQLDSDADRFLETIVDGVRRMDVLIRDLLSYSRAIHEDQAVTPAVDMGGVVREAMSNLEAAIEDAHAVVEVREMPSIVCDRGQMVQVFQNLIGNALKYRSAEPPCIRVSAERENSEWIFRILDNGIGIPAAYHETVFAPFKRLHSSKYAGTGVGLAICKRIVERHGGRIWVSSANGGGAEFCFTVPELYGRARIASA